ncbi:class I SAM-dependent methyltransferase [Oxobacter pfennigii]|nr:class I SAM-dependent methyltransferase [Oxobacter pfennigii]
MESIIWDELWEKWEFQEWDEISEEIYMVLKEEIGELKGKKILEAGSGSGRISLRLALDGASVTLIDFSQKALDISKNYFDKCGVKAEFYNINLKDELPFADNSFDIVWNAGVMEHFTQKEQIKIFKEFSRIAPEVHTFNPNINSFFYRVGKWSAEKNGVWPYGQEFPVETMEYIFKESDMKLQKEYDNAFLDSINFLIFITGGGVLKKRIIQFLNELDENERKKFSDNIGGYLVYSKGIRCKT